MGTAITVAATTWNRSRFQTDESVRVIAVRAIGSRTQTCLRFRWEHLISCEQIEDLGKARDCENRIYCPAITGGYLVS